MLKCFDQVIDGLNNSETLWRNWEKVVFNESHCLVQLKVNWLRTFRQILCLVLVFFLVYPRNLASMVLVKFLFWWFDWGNDKLFLYQYVNSKWWKHIYLFEMNLGWNYKLFENWMSCPYNWTTLNFLTCCRLDSLLIAWLRLEMSYNTSMS